MIDPQHGDNATATKVVTGVPAHTVGAVAGRLSVSERSVLEWIRKGRLRALRLSPRTIRIRQEDLDEFLERARRAAQE